MSAEQFQFSILDVTSEHCRSRVQRTLERVAGVSSVDIDPETGTANVIAEFGVTTREVLIARVEEAGYPVGTMSTP